MKRETLRGLGLDEQAVEKVMAEHGRDIEAALGAARAELENLRAGSTGKEAELENMRARLEEQHAHYEAALTAERLSGAVSAALAGCGARNPALVRRALDMDSISLGEDGTPVGLAEQLEGLRRSDAYLFAPAQGAKAAFASGAGHGGGGVRDYSRMSDAEYYRAMRSCGR